VRVRREYPQHLASLHYPSPAGAHDTNRLLGNRRDGQGVERHGDLRGPSSHGILLTLTVPRISASLPAPYLTVKQRQFHASTGHRCGGGVRSIWRDPRALGHRLCEIDPQSSPDPALPGPSIGIIIIPCVRVEMA
jgi:hypothetical protein